MQGHCVSLHCLNCGHGCGLTSTQGHCVSLQSSDHSHGTSYPSLFTVRCGIYLSADFGCSAFFAAEIATQYSKNNTANIWFPREPPRTAMNDGAISTDTASSFFGIPMYQRCPDVFFPAHLCRRATWCNFSRLPLCGEAHAVVLYAGFLWRPKTRVKCERTTLGAK